MSTLQNTVTATTTRSMMSFRDFQSILRRNCSNELDSNDNNSDSDSNNNEEKAEQVWVEASINQWNIIEKYNTNNNDDDDDVSFPFLLESRVQGSSGYARKKDLISRFLVPNHDDDDDDENANRNTIVSARPESTHIHPVDIFQKYTEDLEVIYNSEDKSVYMLNQLKKKAALKIRQQILNDDSIIGNDYVLHPLLPMCKLSFNFMKNLSGHFGSSESEETNNNNDYNNSNNDFGDVFVKPIKFIVQLSQNKQQDQNRDHTKLVSQISEPQTMSDIHTKVKSTFPSILSSMKDFWDMYSVSSSSESDTTEKEILPSLYNSPLCSAEPYRNGNYIHLKFDPSSSSRTDDSENNNNGNSCSVVKYEKVITKADLLSFISILAWNNEVLYIEYQHRIVLF